jgi:hypothetical protein
VETAKADPARILPEFTTASREADADEPFFQWLRDESSARIDWSTCGSENSDKKCHVDSNQAFAISEAWR